MTPALLEIAYRPGELVLSIVIAVLSAYVGLDLVGRVYRAADRSTMGLWLAAGALALGSGIWAMHFTGMSAAVFPFAIGYEVWSTLGSWLAAVVVSALALAAASRERLSRAAIAIGSLVVGIGAAAMHQLGMHALVVAPGAAHDLLWVAGSAAVAVAGTAATLKIVPGLRGRSGWRRCLRQGGAATVFGGALAAMHYMAMAGTGFLPGSLCLSTGGIEGSGLGVTVGFGALVLLALMLLITSLQRLSDAHAGRLRGSLTQARNDLQFVTFNDAVTGLPNRLVFQDRLKQATARCERAGSSLAVILVDIDGFKLVNEAWTEAGGDDVLREVGARLVAMARDVDTVARVGPDQFLVMVEGIHDANAILPIVKRMAADLRRPIGLELGACRITASIGITVHPADGGFAKLVGNADTAMAAAKRNGGNACCCFEAGMDAAVRLEAELVDDLRLAIERGELQLHYQPKIHARSGLVSGAEALLRWTHPTRGSVSPALFIPLAERFGLVDEIGDWVIDEACRQMQAWIEVGIRMRVAINLSVQQLRNPKLADRISAALARHFIEPSLLTCEITESVAMDVGSSTLAVFEQLRSAGIKLSIDDFGTGYSSLSYLRKLPVVQLKVDRSFVSDLGASDDARSIVAAIIDLAHALRLEVVAEGVETARQRDILLDLGCDEFQGYLFARPMSAGALTGWAIDQAGPQEAFRPSIFAAA